MKILIKEKIKILFVLGFVASTLVELNSCTASKKIEAKSGAQLWAENCQRCHNTPSPSSFSPEQWETIGMHMQTRGLITDKERDKIVAFLKQ